MNNSDTYISLALSWEALCGSHLFSLDNNCAKKKKKISILQNRKLKFKKFNNLSQILQLIHDRDKMWIPVYLVVMKQESGLGGISL